MLLLIRTYAVMEDFASSGQPRYAGSRPDRSGSRFARDFARDLPTEGAGKLPALRENFLRRMRKSY